MPPLRGSIPLQAGQAYISGNNPQICRAPLEVLEDGEGEPWAKPWRKMKFRKAKSAAFHADYIAGSRRTSKDSFLIFFVA
jgi:hypothetical protein